MPKEIEAGAAVLVALALFIACIVCWSAVAHSTAL